ncbi:MAG: hypothetical protein KC444_07245 [Nitrosopumilus sp.]|nr:hypothetical protein [Nitrosopumilus sp.]
MNKKIIVSVAVAAVIMSSLLVVIALKTTLGDDAAELPGEEGIEKTYNLQEENERGESAADEAREYGGK